MLEGLLFIILYMLMAASFTLAKAILAYSSPIFFVGVRMGIAGIALLMYCWWYGIHKDIMRQWKNFAITIVFHVYLAFVLDLVALEYMTSFKGAFIYNLSPFFAALCSYFYFNERMTLRKWVGLTIGFIGFLPELIFPGGQETMLGGIGFLSWAEIMMIGSVAASVIGWTVVRALVKDGYSPMLVNGVGMFGGGMLALITSFLFESAPFVTNWAWFIYLLIAIIICGNILLYNVYGHLLKKYTATFLSFAGFLCPLFAALFGWLFLGESISWHFFFSLIVVVAGLALFYSEELKQGYIVH